MVCAIWLYARKIPPRPTNCRAAPPIPNQLPSLFNLLLPRDIHPMAAAPKIPIQVTKLPINKITKEDSCTQPLSKARTQSFVRSPYATPEVNRDMFLFT